LPATGDGVSYGFLLTVGCGVGAGWSSGDCGRQAEQIIAVNIIKSRRQSAKR